MKKISSGSTVFYKNVFPVIWFGFLAVFLTMALMTGAGRKELGFLLVPCVMAAFGYVLMKNLVWDLADEVYDGGDFLLVKNRGEEDRIPLSEIMNVDSSITLNPPRITLRLTKARRFGTEVSFSPVKNFTLNPFARSRIAEDLIARAARARQGG